MGNMRPTSGRSPGVCLLFVTAVVLPVLLAILASGWLAFQLDRLARVADWIDRSDRVIALIGEVERHILVEENGVGGQAGRTSPSTDETTFAKATERDLTELEQLLAGQPAEVAKTRFLAETHRRWERATHAEAIDSPDDGDPASEEQRETWRQALETTSAALVRTQKSVRLAHVRRFEKTTAQTTLGAVAFLAVLAGAASLGSLRQIRCIEGLVRREHDALCEPKRRFAPRMPS